MTTFKSMGLAESLLHTLAHIQFNKPTPIQQKAIPFALDGKDIFASAQTGTGKTGAFLIPMITGLQKKPNSTALVIAPTRELAAQIISQANAMLGRRSKIKAALLIGGEAIHKQLTQLRHKPRIIIGTPGRINDHLERKSLNLSKTDFLVLDETDRMLDMGFSDQIEMIKRSLPKQRQTLLFSATLPKSIENIANQYLTDPVRIAMNPTSSPASNIKQEIVRTKENNKFNELITALNNRKGSIIIFVKTKFSTEKIAKKLTNEGHRSSAIHGDLRQHKRTRVITDFRKKKYRILVATDVASRGLDIPHIEHVINYDLPQCAEDYIHRIGRTARAGAKGMALNLVTPVDNQKWNAIQRLLNPKSKGTQKTAYKKKRRFSKHRKTNAKQNHKGRKWKKRKNTSRAA